jgi:hypothetical protein
MMKITRFTMAAGYAALICAACGQIPAFAVKETVVNESREALIAKQPVVLNAEKDDEDRKAALFDAAEGNFTAQLEELAELERSGGFVPGLGIAESGLRERFGDYAGAVLAIYKELSWAYSLGEGGLTRESVLESLDRVQELDAGPGAKEAALAAHAFFEGRWDEAAALIKQTFAESGLDAYSNWMLLVCVLEQGGASSETQDLYAVIRARYETFPEYWYRGARSLPEQTARMYAERCLNLSAAGPFAAECRRIIAKTAGLDEQDGAALKTRTEVERITSAALQAGKPELLEELLPMLALPDNPYTLFLSGALRAFNPSELFRNWFSAEAAKAKGHSADRAAERLAERLTFIIRG